MALFPGPPRWAGARRELRDFMVQGEINKGRHTVHPARRHSIRTNQCPPPPSPHIFLLAGCPSCRPTNSVKALRLQKHISEQRIPVVIKPHIDPLYPTIIKNSTFQNSKMVHSHRLENWKIAVYRLLFDRLTQSGTVTHQPLKLWALTLNQH